MKIKICVCISTYGNRAGNVKNILLKSQPNVRYVIIHQISHNNQILKKEFYYRSDIKYYSLKSKGLAKSRNYAIKKSNNDEIILLSDDDVKFKNEYFKTIQKIYNDNPNLDVCCFKIKTPINQKEFKNYKKHEIQIDKYKDLTPCPSSIEITFKKISIIKNKLRFDIRFGAGAFFIGGEEKLFLHNCISKKLNIKYIPKYIVEHDYESTRSKYKKYGKDKSRYLGAHNYMKHGILGLFISVFSGLKNFNQIKKNNVNPFLTVFFTLQGYLYMFFTDLKLFKKTKIN